MVKTMSDPVTNVEIEDVLSSIRRLVSSDERPKPAAPGPAPAATPAEPERLVLTPSLRIDNAAPDLSDDAAGAEADLHRDAPIHSEASPAEANVSLPANIALQKDAGEDGALNVPEEAASPAEMFAMNDPATPEPPRDAKAELKARVAELEEVVSRQGDQWEPDGASADDNSGSPVAPLPWEDYVPGPDENAPEDAADPAAPDAFRDLADKQDSMPDDTGPDETDDSPDNPSAERKSGADAPEEDHGGSRDFLAANDEFLDEDALRDLVADIVRQELQGALGERITRNVRKLVRREIHRALASQELH